MEKGPDKPGWLVFCVFASGGGVSWAFWLSLSVLFTFSLFVGTFPRPRRAAFFFGCVSMSLVFGRSHLRSWRRGGLVVCVGSGGFTTVLDPVFGVVWGGSRPVWVGDGNPRHLEHMWTPSFTRPSHPNGGDVDAPPDALSRTRPDRPTGTRLEAITQQGAQTPPPPQPEDTTLYKAPKPVNWPLKPVCISGTVHCLLIVCGWSASVFVCSHVGQPPADFLRVL